MEVRCNFSPSFGRLEGNLAVESGNQEIADAKEALKSCKHWHVIADNDGSYKLKYSDTSKVYELADKPKRHAKNALFIRTFDKGHKVQGKVTSFRVDLDSYEEVQSLYKRIMGSKGLEKMVIVAKALEQQVLKRNYQKKLRSLFGGK